MGSVMLVFGTNEWTALPFLLEDDYKFFVLGFYHVISIDVSFINLSVLFWPVRTNTSTFNPRRALVLHPLEITNRQTHATVQELLIGL